MKNILNEEETGKHTKEIIKIARYLSIALLFLMVVLFKYNNNWYHFEHSNTLKKGIHKYDCVNDAIKEITSGFEEHNDVRVLTEIPNIPTSLSFKEFNQYVNQFDAVYLDEHNNKIK